MYQGIGALIFIGIILFFIFRNKFGIKLQRKTFLILLLIAIISLIFSVLEPLSEFYTNFLFFKELNFQSVFLKNFFSKLIFYIVGFAISFLILFSLSGYPSKNLYALDEDEVSKKLKILKILRFAGIIFISHIVGVIFSSSYKEILLFIYQTPSLIKDPIFSRSISFYFFIYPVLSKVLNIFLLLFITLTIFEFIVLSLVSSVSYSKSSRPGILSKISFLGGFILLITALKTYISIYSFLFFQTGTVFGVGNTDFYIRIPVLKIVSIGFLIMAVSLFINALKPKFNEKKVLSVVLIVTLIFYFVLIIGIPQLYQSLVVKPTELEKESKFLDYNIESTLKAYDLDVVKEITFYQDIKPLTKEKLETNKDLFESIRLWDWRALSDTYKQIQSIRLYYTFKDIDVDRYMTGGKEKEVMLSVRELSQSLLPETSRSFVNDKMIYTHGYGLCLNYVNEFTKEGLPVLLIKDIPPTSGSGLPTITRPEIYYGEMTDSYVFVNTRQKEFDFPKGDENVYSLYQGDGGIKLGILPRLAFTLKYGNINILLSEYLTPTSKIMINRNIKDRIGIVAPFLKLDYDPYIVIGSDGKLLWFGSAYTMSEFYPYSKYVKFQEDHINYIRNSVVYTVDPYNGKVSFYIRDKEDPIINTYKKIYPSLFKDFDELSLDIRNHYRYPEDLFKIQSNIYSIYHMKAPQTFYNQEDKWMIAKEKYERQDKTMDPYYLFMELQKDIGKEFVLALPFTPANKDNMVSIFIGRCDESNQGKTALIKFPRDKLIFGPYQIEARVDQESEISKTLTLWNQQGSQVLRGNLLTIPVNGSILYIEPIYLQAETSKMPQIKKIVVATQDKLVWGDTFAEALSTLLNEKVSFDEKPETPEQPKTYKELIEKANYHFKKYQEYTSKGEFELAGKELKELENILKLLVSMP